MTFVIKRLLLDFQPIMFAYALSMYMLIVSYTITLSTARIMGPIRALKYTYFSSLAIIIGIAVLPAKGCAS